MQAAIFIAAALGIPAGYSQQPATKPIGFSTPKLKDITASTGIHFEHLSSPEQRYIVESMSGGVALFDYDGDGWLDIYFTNAPSVAMTLAGKKAKGALYHNNHDGTFTDVTDKAGVGFRVGRWAPRLRMSITTAVPICWSVASAGSCFITTTATARSPTSPRSRDCRKTRDGLRAQPMATPTAMAILTFSFRIMSTSNWMIFRSSVQRKPVSITTSPFSAVRVVCKVLRMRCTTTTRTAPSPTLRPRRVSTTASVTSASAPFGRTSGC